MKLNPKKCTFGVRSGKFLGYMIDQRGIEANPDKIWVILHMWLPTTIREVQKLTGCVAALGRFMSRSADKCLPFFRVLKRKTLFGWDEEAERAFQKLKECLGQLPRMVRANLKEHLLLYLVVSDCAVSAILVAERSRQQYPVYYVSHVLTGPESRYLLVEKFAYALRIASRKLRPYFESHPITVLTDQPLRSTLENTEVRGEW